MPSSAVRPGERILIVDDEDQIRTLLARLLGAQGYDCVTADSPAQARRQLREHPVALVLSDVNMPGGSGIDFTREVLAHYPDTAVVMVTGMDDRAYADVARRLKGEDVPLVVPSDKSGLLNKLFGRRAA